MTVNITSAYSITCLAPAVLRLAPVTCSHSLRSETTACLPDPFCRRRKFTGSLGSSVGVTVHVRFILQASVRGKTQAARFPARVTCRIGTSWLVTHLPEQIVARPCTAS